MTPRSKMVGEMSSTESTANQKQATDASTNPALDSSGRVLSPAEIRHCFSSQTWVSPEALPQLKKTAELSGMIYIAAMPDLHPGAGTPGGAAFVSQGLIHPKLIGGDIGCGMHMCVTSIAARTSVQRIASKLASIDGVWPGDLAPWLDRYGLESSPYDSALGTIGGGNHFAELQIVHEIADQESVDDLGIDTDHALLLVHSGSRGLGQAVLNAYNSRSRGVPLDPDSPEGREYIAGHEQAMRYAKLNRTLIADRIVDKLGASSSTTFDLSHNFLEHRTAARGDVWIHRKGAAPSDQGLVVIPGSRSSYTYLVRPKGNGEINAHSLAHGAGRKISRSQCDEKFGRLSPEDLRRPKDKKSGIDNLVICENRDLLRQEHGKAYKDIDQVIKDLVQLGLAEVVAVFKPILTYKTRNESDDGEG
jgi:release factor H-coupled RctB family protein